MVTPQTETHWDGTRARPKSTALASRRPAAIWKRLSRAFGLLGGGVLSLYAARLYGRRRSQAGAAAAALAGAGLIAQSLVSSQRRGRVLGWVTKEARKAGAPQETIAVKTTRSITIQRSAHDLYLFWRDLTNLPQVIRYIDFVEVDETGTARWSAQGPRGMHVTWQTRVTQDKPGELIEWESVEGGDLTTAGSIAFRQGPTDRGTEVCLELSFQPPGGKLGAWFMKTLGHALAQQVEDDLRRFKQLMEAGELPTIKGQPSGRR